LYVMKDFKKSAHVFLSPANSFAKNNIIEHFLCYFNY
jgi:hypothetical protein